MRRKTVIVFECSACGSEHRVERWPADVPCECGRLFEVRSRKHIVVKSPPPGELT